MNIFPGINPILTSNLLANGRWISLHNTLIPYLTLHINQELPPGYIAYTEASIALKRADIAIMQQNIQTHSQTVSQASLAAASLSPQAVAEVESLGDEEESVAIGIYRENADDPIAWLEILSPTNKRGLDLERYRAKRTDLVHEEITFDAIIDYHDHTAKERARQPFHIWSLSPSLAPDDMLHSNHQAFNPSNSIPSITIPLAGADVVSIHLGAAYDRIWDDRQFTSQSQTIPPRLVNDFPLYRDLVYIAATLLANSTANKATPSPELLQSLNHDPQRVANILGVADLPDTTPSAEFD